MSKKGVAGRARGNVRGAWVLLVFTASLGLFLAAAGGGLESSFDKGLCGWSVNDYENRLSIGVTNCVLGTNALVVARATKSVDTAWGVKSPEFPVRGGEAISVEVRAAGTVPMSCPAGGKDYATYVGWLTADGTELSDFRSFGLELASNAWRVTTVACDVPRNAVRAYVMIGTDRPNVRPGEWIAISGVTVREHRAALPLEARVTLRDDGVVLVGGRPFFPIGLYGVSKREFNGWDIRRAFGSLKDAGFNFAHTYYNVRNDDYRDFLAAAEEHGIKLWLPTGIGANHAMDAQNVLEERTHPSLLAWYIGDDTSDHLSPADVRSRHDFCHALDPAHLTVQADIVGELRAHCCRAYARCSDVFMPELYPVKAAGQTGFEVPEVIRDMKTISRDYEAEGRTTKSVWAIIQHFDGWGVWKRFPTLVELRAMSFAALVQGARGIVWYTYGGDGKKGRGVTQTPERWREICSVSGEIASLQTDLVTRDAAVQPTISVLSGPLQNALGRPSVDCLLKESGLLMAVNSSTNAVRVEVSMSGGRSVVMPLDPYGVRWERVSR